MVAGACIRAAPGIALGLIVRHFLGLSGEASALSLDPVIPAALDGLRVETTLFGRAIQVQYRIRGAGCGVTALMLNGAPLPFTHRHNPHRRGAALVAKPALLTRLTTERNTLTIEVG